MVPDRVSVTSADFVRNIGAWQEQALKVPVSITYHGRERLILLAADRYVLPGDLSDADAGGGDHALLNHISEGYIAYDDEHVITNVNRVTEAYLGVGRADLIGRTAESLYPQLRGSMLLEQVQRVAVTRSPITFEADSLLFDKVRLLVSAYPIGSGVGVLFANITEQHALRAASARADSVISGIAKHRHVALIEIDVRGRFTSVDDKFAQWVGFDRAALQNGRLVDLVAATDRRRVADALDSVVSSRTPQAAEAQFVSKQGGEPVLSLSFALMQSENGLMRIHGAVTAKPQSQLDRPNS